MKRLLLAGVAVTMLAGPAYSQTVIREGTTGVAPSATVRIEPEQRTRIRSYVTERRIPPARIRERVRVGAVVDEDVELMAVPEDWGPDLRRYRYVYYDDNVYLIEPSSRRVVHVID
jgi:Protein of unknown function (DUF1236)